MLGDPLRDRCPVRQSNAPIRWSRRVRLRRLKFVREQFFLAAVAQNIKQLVRFLSQPTTPTLEAAT